VSRQVVRHDHYSLRITFLSPSAQIGGAERCLLDLVHGLAEQKPDWRAHVIASGSGPLTDELNRLGVSHEAIPFPRALERLGDTPEGGGESIRSFVRVAWAAPSAAKYIHQIRDALMRERPDVVHTNGFKMHAIGALASPGSWRLLWHMHDFLSLRRVMIPLLRFEASRCSLAVGNSESVASDLRDVLGKRVEIRAILNGVDLNRFSGDGPMFDLDDASGLAPAPQGTVRVGLVAQMATWKGHDVFLRAVALVPKTIPLRAYIIGDRIYESATPQYRVSELREIASQLGIADRVGFTGRVNDIPSLMRALDVVVHASTKPEPFGLVIVEAMASGRPVIVSNAGGASEILKTHNGQFALAHTPGNVNELARAIESLCTDAELRNNLGKEGKRQAALRFDVRRYAREFADTYSELAKPISEPHRFS
jgi:glycosyltransferase involved in cell wall biosynthesis